MSLPAAKKVLSFAQQHQSFRAALRSDPKNAVQQFSQDIGLAGNETLTIEEFDALVSFTDSDFEAFNNLSKMAGDSLGGQGHEGNGIH